ncbi:MAG TPA: ATP-binding protein [Candidatus Korarchaeota archaeon]|nr:ATP-binding protein [Candidatus Korarchaeota archaeon]
MVISISGKGGTGKTTIAALLLKVLLDNGKNDSILMVDADPASNLQEVLGVRVEKSVGRVANELKKKIEKGELPMGVSKADLLEAWVYETLVELPDYDLLVMGRTEGEGCYCYVNSILTRILDAITKNYDVTIMDMEAGLEHLSRRTDRDVDVMLIVTDPSSMGLKTAERIKELAHEVHINVKKIFLVGNKFPQELVDVLEERTKKMGIEFGGLIPSDPNVIKFNMEGRSLLELPKDSPALRAVENIARKIGLL